MVKVFPRKSFEPAKIPAKNEKDFYDAELLNIFEETKDVNRSGKVKKKILWRWIFKVKRPDGSELWGELRGSTNPKFSPKSNAYKRAENILGKKIEPGTISNLEDLKRNLIGKSCRIHIKDMEKNKEKKSNGKRYEQTYVDDVLPPTK